MGLEDKQLLCDEKHKNIEEKLKLHDDRLNSQSGKLDELRDSQSELRDSQIRTDSIVSNLCDKIELLVVEMKEGRDSEKRLLRLLLGCAGTIIVVLVGFLLWYIQSLPR